MKKKIKQLSIEESERELVLKHERYICKSGAHFDSLTKIKVSPKTLKITHDNYKGSSLKFEKSSGLNPILEINLEWLIKKTQKCSLGHEHEISKEEKEYEWFKIPWKDVDNLVDWLKEGTWYEAANKESPTERLLKQCLDFAELVSKNNDYLKPTAQQLKIKINNLLEPHRINMLSEKSNDNKTASR